MEWINYVLECVEMELWLRMKNVMMEIILRGIAVICVVLKAVKWFAEALQVDVTHWNTAQVRVGHVPRMCRTAPPVITQIAPIMGCVSMATVLTLLIPLSLKFVSVILDLMGHIVSYLSVMCSQIVLGVQPILNVGGAVEPKLALPVPLLGMLL